MRGGDHDASLANVYVPRQRRRPRFGHGTLASLLFFGATIGVAAGILPVASAAPGQDGAAPAERVEENAATFADTPRTKAAPAKPGAGSAVVAEASLAHGANVFPVRFRGEPLLEIRLPIGALTPQERAAAIERRLEIAASLPDSTLDAVRTQRRPGSFDVHAGEQFVMSVTPADAAPLGRTAEQRAEDVAVLVREALRREYAERSAAGLLRAAVLSVAAFAIALAAWFALGLAIRSLERLWTRAVARAHRNSEVETLSDGAANTAPAVDAPEAARRLSARRLLSEQVGEVVSVLLRYVRFLVGVVLAVFAVGYAMSLYPWTRGAAAALDREIRGAFRAISGSVVEYLPNLVYIAILVFVFRVLIKFARLFFARIGSGQLQIRGFHAEWGAPTFQIVRVLLIAFAIAVMFPYLPASDSRAFQGVTVLLGVILSFGSASAVANLIGGLVITYMRALSVGDRVKIGDAEGDVVGRDAFVVRVRTIKNVEITIPNSSVLSGAVVNFTAGTRDVGLLLHTTVTIGYDVPWRRVHELLLASARKTAHVDAAPPPFVLQTSLGDFSVAYQINAYTKQASRASAILSELHAHIQDEFATAGIEIMSPAYEAQRDGSGRALPPMPPNSETTATVSAAGPVASAPSPLRAASASVGAASAPASAAPA
jgi:small-conductance mechanosensitive channel